MTQEQIAEREIRLLEEIKQDLQGRIDRIRESIKPELNDEKSSICSICYTTCWDCGKYTCNHCGKRY